MVDVSHLLALASSLRGLDTSVDDAVLVDQLRALEVLKAAAAAAQARAAAALDTSQRAAQAAAGVPAAQHGLGVGSQVALARRESPHRGARLLGLAKALVHEMPNTLAALQDGRISEWRATLLVRETAVLTREDRVAVDLEVAGDPERPGPLELLGDRALVARARQVAYRLDPYSVVERSRRAVDERRVTIRPAPDTMAYLTALLPARDAIAVHTALARVADSTRSTGGRGGRAGTRSRGGPGAADGGGDQVEARGRGQLMADTLVARILEPGTTPGAAAAAAGAGATRAGGAARAAAAAGAGPAPRSRPRDVAVRLVMTDRALLDGDPEPAHLDGYGPVPAAWARDLVAGTLEAGRPPGGPWAVQDGGVRVFVTRLFTDHHGSLVAMDSRARTAPAGLADLIRTRDAGTCRTPWCDAPVRHVDHVTPHAAGGSTTAHDLQGLCEGCNYVKQAHGWRQQAGPPDPGPSRHVVVTTTPTGHTYPSHAPPLPGSSGPPGPPARTQRRAREPVVGTDPAGTGGAEESVGVGAGVHVGTRVVVDVHLLPGLEAHLAGRLLLAA